MFVANVRVLITESEQPLPGVAVSLYDRDRHSADDLLGTARTDGQGLATIEFSGRSFGDDPSRVIDDSPGRLDLLPDVYVVVHGASGEVVTSTRERVQENQVPGLVTIKIGWEAALEHGLARRKPVRTEAERQQEWSDYWKKRATTGPHPGPPVDLCVARVVLGAISAARRPRNELQKRVAAALADRIPSRHLPQVIELAARGVRNIDATGLLEERACSSSSDPVDLVKLLMAPGGPLDAINDAMVERQASPWDTVGPQGPGCPFMAPFGEWDKVCLTRFEQQDASLDEIARQQMADYLANGLELLVPPVVNEIEVFRPFIDSPGSRSEGFPARYTRTHLGTTTMKELDFRGGMRTQGVDLNVRLDDGGCLYHFSDGRRIDGQLAQVVATDVKLGETVTLRGASFIDETAVVSARFSPWKPDAVDGKLVPENPNPAADWEALTWWEGTELAVHGRQLQPGESLEGRSPLMYIDDKIVFDWPANARRPGLYRLQLTFKNRDRLPTGARQDPRSCRVEIETADYVRTQVLWFAVLPEAGPRLVRARATTVECEDLTNPEIWPDNVTFVGTGLVTGPLIDPSNPDEPNAEIRVPARSIDDTFWFYFDHHTRHPSPQEILPERGAARSLRRDEFIIVSMVAEEVEGPLDIFVMSSLIVAVLVTIVTILVIMAVAVVIVLVASGVLPTSVAVVILGGVLGTWLGAVLAAILSGAFIGALTAAVKSAAGSEPVAIGASTFSGNEIAHWYSPFRIHRLLWPRERGELRDTGFPTSRSTDFRDGEIEETFTCRAAGGRYSVRMVLDVG